MAQAALLPHAAHLDPATAARALWAMGIVSEVLKMPVHAEVAHAAYLRAVMNISELSLSVRQLNRLCFVVVVCGCEGVKSGNVGC